MIQLSTGVTINGRWLEPLLLLCIHYIRTPRMHSREIHKRGGVANVNYGRAYWSVEFTRRCFQPWLYVWRKQHKKNNHPDSQSLWLF